MSTSSTFSSGTQGGSESRTLTIGGFRVEQTLQAGSGSQGTVYKAVCMEACEGIADAGDVVALKVMIAQGDAQNTWRRLEKRTAELAGLKHENVVRYRGCFAVKGDFSDTYVVVQDFLEGETLKERLARSPCGMDADQALDVLKQALSGLDYVSRSGMVHRDIKPGNIFLCRDGKVKLIDFEIAHREGGTSTTGINAQGTFDYMAPDFLDQSFRGDIRSDVFSMGVVMHEMLSGRKPYRSLDGDQRQANFAWAARWSGSESPIHVSSRIERILAGAKDVITCALSRDRSARYGDFGVFREAVRAIRYRNLKNGESTYRLLQYIGKGGFGEVFKARRLETGEFVAVKHLLKENYADRFRREAKIMQKLLDFDDACFARFLDFFCTVRPDGSSNAFLVMAYLDGMPGNSLRDAIKSAASMFDGRLLAIDVLRAFRRYAHALDEMHRKGIFHRDIKPSNLYYPKGRPDQARIMDLGIARDENGTVTSDKVPGTLDYMPPEVAKGSSRGDSRMDIYALGLCFYEALTGRTAYPRLPSGTAGYKAFFKRAESGVPPTLDASPVAGDERLLTLISEMTNPDDARRIADAGEVETRIDEIIRSFEGFSQPSDAGGATITITIPDQDADRGTRTGRTEFNDDRAIQAEKERIADAKRRFRLRMFGAAASLLVLCGIGAAAWRFAPQVKAIFQPKPQLPVPAALPEPTNAVPERIPVGTVVFHVADGISCEFNSRNVSATDKFVLPVTGQYECVYSNLKKDEYGNSMYDPKTVRFRVVYTNRLNEVRPPESVEWNYSKAYVNALNANFSNKIQQVEASANALVEKERANSATNMVAMKRQIDEKEAAKEKLAEAEKQQKIALEESRKKIAQKEQERKEREAREKELAAMKAQAAIDVTNRVWTLLALSSDISAEERKRRLEEADGIYKAAVASNILESVVVAEISSAITEGRFDVKRMEEQQKKDADQKKKAEELAAERERQKRIAEEAERQRIKAMVSATNRIWTLLAKTTPVTERQARLREADDIYRQVSRSNILDRAADDALFDAIRERRRWEVGSVANRCRDEVTVAGRRIAPGAVETFVFKDGMPNPWEALRRGYEPLALEIRFDGKELSLEEAMFVRGDVEIAIPALPDGVTCLVGGEAKTGSMKRKPGAKIAYSYRRRGYEYAGAKEYTVTDAASQSLPPPRAADWKVLPAAVSVPVMVGIQCLVDGNEATGGSTMNVLPGKTLSCTYRQKGFHDVEKKYTVIVADIQNLPVPAASEWTPVKPTVDVKDVLEEVEIAYGGEAWQDVLKYLAQAKALGHELTDEDKEKFETAYDNVSRRINGLIKEKEANLKIKGGKISNTSGYGLPELYKEKDEVAELYRKLKQ